MSEGTRVATERRNGVGYIRLTRPEKRNALDRQTAEELFAALSTLEADPTVRVIVLRGEGKDFCAGADLEALAAMIGEPNEVHREDAESLGRVFLAIRTIVKPIVAAVHGRALAGGAGLAIACDLVLAQEEANFGFPEVRVGFVPAMVMTMLRRCVGEKHAADLVLTGRIIGAEEGARIGLVSRILPGRTFDADVERIVEEMARSPKTAMALTKWLFHKLDELSFADGIAAGIVTNVEARLTEDFREGVRSFVARGKEGR
ncbi:MAG: enoyl-CoA hydratase/isomerase family protein [Gemmatimonadaceae bacterium]|nr:enoyl-CoA hydratase/isomerase family protein [Gemmatimonadaceae bacterium]NUR19141.1 enoyl-CoA hydratase/isomerase family protein [Gemmatimonadaceae bacterium]NUS97431.1 enoyl-CoA hydratase/isomerase family protein [Gemmatimonadaceae bacterium]